MHIPPRFTIEDDDLDLLARFTKWISRVAGYARLEYLRKLEYKTRERPLEQFSPETLCYEDPPPDTGHEFAFGDDKLNLAFSNLNLLRRSILTLVFAEGLSAQETADKLNCTVDYVYLQKHRALKKLRDQLMEGGGKCGE